MKCLRFVANDAIIRVYQAKARFYSHSVAVSGQFFHTLYDATAVWLPWMVIVIVLKNRLFPEIQAIQITVSEKERTLVGLERPLF